MTDYREYPVIEHELDAAWLIAMWLVRHHVGGDPGPDDIWISETSMLAAATLISSLAATHHVDAGGLTFERLAEHLNGLGFAMTRGEEPLNGNGSGRRYCFTGPNGRTVCVTTPPPPHLLHRREWDTP